MDVSASTAHHEIVMKSLRQRFEAQVNKDNYIETMTKLIVSRIKEDLETKKSLFDDIDRLDQIINISSASTALASLTLKSTYIKTDHINTLLKIEKTIIYSEDLPLNAFKLIPAPKAMIDQTSSS